MLNIIICDDNLNDRNKVVNAINTFMAKNKIEHRNHIFSDYNEKFMKMISDNLPFKIYILDIEMPSGSGIDIARTIRNRDLNSIIIFLTGHEELGNIVLKNDLLFLSFINKFDDFENRLHKSLNKALYLLNHKKIIRLNDKNVTYTIDIEDILYITTDSFERKSIIHTDYSEFKVHHSLSEILSMLDDRFIQTHRACYINTERVTIIDKKNKIITFDNGDNTSLLSDKYKRSVKL